MANDDRAIIVGVQTYPGLDDLSGPENDARAFANWVRSPTGGNVPAENVVQILSSDYHPPFPSPQDAEPTTEKVEEALERLQDIADANAAHGKPMRVGRRLYLYLAGHGLAPVFDQAALLMANATRMRAGYHIAGKLYAGWFLQAGYFDEIVLFMDCCRENYPKAPLHMPPWITVTDPTAVDRTKVFYGFATKWSRLSRERTMPDGLVRGVFTYALIEALKGAAADAAGQVTATSLGSWLYNNMKSYLSPADLQDPDVAKEPELVYDANGGNNFVFAMVPPPLFTVRIHLPAASAGKNLTVLGDKFQPVAATVAQPPLYQLQLARGIYLTQIAGNGQQPVFEVKGTGDVDVNF